MSGQSQSHQQTTYELLSILLGKAFNTKDIIEYSGKKICTPKYTSQNFCQIRFNKYIKFYEIYFSLTDMLSSNKPLDNVLEEIKLLNDNFMLFACVYDEYTRDLYNVERIWFQQIFTAIAKQLKTTDKSLDVLINQYNYSIVTNVSA